MKMREMKNERLDFVHSFIHSFRSVPYVISIDPSHANFPHSAV
jgi:hypothetical protein